MSGAAGRRVFLTGASGFVGAQVTRVLLSAGCEVHALLQPGVDPWRIRDVLGRLHVVEGDLTHPRTWATSLKAIKPEMCIHLAWYAEHGKYWTALENLDALSASLNLVRQLVRLGCERFVGIGTCVEYDTHQGYLSEESTLRPATLYAASKLALHQVLAQVGQATAMQTAWARLFYLYGPMEDPRRLVPQVIRSLLKNETVKTTSGQQVRDYLHIEDVGVALWEVARSDLTGAVNVGSGQPVTVAEVVSAIGRITGREEKLELGGLPMPPDEPMVICARVEKLRATGWKARYDLEAGLRHTIRWWEERDRAK